MSKDKGEIVVPEEKAFLTGAQIKTQVNAIQDVMRTVMKNGIHYGTIPGCGEKPALLKPGAEKIMLTFQLSNENVIEDLSTEDERRYRVSVKLSTRGGNPMGAGIGECSSSEEKFKWRRAICEEEYEETPVDRKRLKWTKGKEGPYQIKQVRMNPVDIANTILKIGKKRGLIDAVLTSTAASDIFAQDFEEMPPEVAEAVSEGSAVTPVKESTKPVVKQPKEVKPAEPKGEPGMTGYKAEKPISQPQAGRLYAISTNAGYTQNEVQAWLWKNFGIEHTILLDRTDYDEVCEWFESHPKERDDATI